MRKKFGPLVGTYEGTLAVEGGRNPRRVSLVLVPMLLIVQNPGRNDVSEVATLDASIEGPRLRAGFARAVPGLSPSFRSGRPRRSSIWPGPGTGAT
ncbi:MAG: hypothetical protein NDJ89_07335 [Oligoflexia bacterium]|nr:hypothetical protein [Oligoflexia bacterium]